MRTIFAAAFPATSPVTSQRLATFMTSFLLCGILFWPVTASAQQSNDASRSNRLERLRSLRQSFQSIETQLASVDTEESIYVNAAEGRDIDRCGTQSQPCRTITQGLKRAREIQTGPRAKDIELINIEIASGTYAESVEVKLNWIRFRGAGAGASVIQSPAGSAVTVLAAQPVFFEGLTMRAQNAAGLGGAGGSFISVSGCEFRDSKNGIALFTQSVAEVSSSTFTNNRNNSVFAISGSIVILLDSVITGQSTNQGTGVVLGDGGMAELQNVSISQTRTAVSIGPTASLFTFGGVNITNNRVGCFVAGSSYLELTDSTVSNNSEVGISLDVGASAGISRVTVNNNGTGIMVNGNSFLRTEGGEVKFNTIGISFDFFGKGMLLQLDISNNNTNTQTSRGGEFFALP